MLVTQVREASYPHSYRDLALWMEQDGGETWVCYLILLYIPEGPRRALARLPRQRGIVSRLPKARKRERKPQVGMDLLAQRSLGHMY